MAPVPRFGVLGGNYDGHTKNVGLIHNGAIIHIAEMYNAVPAPHMNDEPSRTGSKKRSVVLPLAIDGEFQHHNITRVDLANDAESWGILSAARAEEKIEETLQKFATALHAASLPAAATPHLDDRLSYILERLGSGKSIDKPKLRLLPRRQA